MFRLTHDTPIDRGFALEVAVATDTLFADDRDLTAGVIPIMVALLTDRPTEPVLRTLFVACARLLDVTHPSDPDVPVSEMADELMRYVMQGAWGFPDDGRTRQAQLIATAVVDDGMVSEHGMAELTGESGPADLLVLLVQMVTGLSTVLATVTPEDAPSAPLRAVLHVGESAGPPGEGPAAGS